MPDDGHLEASPDNSPSNPNISQSFKLAQPAEEHSGDVTERITFYVAPNETGRAGLGVSVKGKTEPSDEGPRDLGIFVNAVLQGGAAFKVNGGLWVLVASFFSYVESPLPIGGLL